MKSTYHFFAKLPGTGKAKTRLRADLPDLLVDGLYRGLIDQMVALGKSLLDSNKQGEVKWWWDEVDESNSVDLPETFQVEKQIQGNLGSRLEEAFPGEGVHFFLGMDCPILDVGLIKDILDFLEKAKNPKQSVILPAQDGGFVLLATGSLPKRTLEPVRWGTEKAASDTEKQLKAAGCAVCVWQPVLWDIDFKRDLVQLQYEMDSQNNDQNFETSLKLAMKNLREHIITPDVGAQTSTK